MKGLKKEVKVVKEIHAQESKDHRKRKTSKPNFDISEILTRQTRRKCYC